MSCRVILPMPEMRRDPLSGDWVIFSPERSQRPANFLSTYVADQNSFDPFLEGNESLTTPEILADRKAGTHPNEPGWQARVIHNKYPAIGNQPASRVSLQVSCQCEAAQFNQGAPAHGAHDVIVESPHRVARFTELSVGQVQSVFRLYRERWKQLQADPKIEYAILFKNEGPPAGASMEHVHSQILGLPTVPQQMQRELEAAGNYRAENGQSYFDDLVKLEQEQQVRLVSESPQFTTFCPYASRFAYETWIVPMRSRTHFSEISDSEIDELSKTVRMTLNRLNSILGDFSFNYIIQSAPFRGEWEDRYCWSLRLIPRTSQLAGFELGSGMNINAVLPEVAARQLREGEIPT